MLAASPSSYLGAPCHSDALPPPTHLFAGTTSTLFPGGTAATPYFDDIKAAINEQPVPVVGTTWGAIKRLYR